MRHCEKCELCKTRQNVVMGMGVPKAEILFIGEAPGAQEDETGLPFVGRSGKLLDTFLNDIGLSRTKNIYIANIIKCRPPQNRDPLPAEWDACLPYLRTQFKFLRPKIVVCLGRIAAQRIMRPDFSVMKEHGTWTVKNGTYFTATLHPAALLRNPNNTPLALQDFRAIQEKINELCDHTY
ncbi:MAG: uracil-DNA glycosylase [Oscillospiraceae bacterium]|nr:uracil-DNA glycosylase [Oscillospiraceae bacterium]